MFDSLEITHISATEMDENSEQGETIICCIHAFGHYGC